MSERDLTRAMDRVAADSPPMDVSLEAVIGQARGRRRQRRAVGAGMGIATLALAGTLWWGLAGGGLLGGGLDEAPAGPTGELSVDGGDDGLVADGSRIERTTGDTVTAGDRTFRIEQREDSVYLVEDGVPVADLGTRVTRHGPSFTDEFGPGAVVAMVAGGADLDPASLRVGGASDAGTWQQPDSAVRVDLTDGRSVVVAGLAEMETVATVTESTGGPRPWELLGAQVGGEVDQVPVAVFGDRALDIYAGGADLVTVLEDGRELEGVAVPGASAGSMTYPASDGSSAFVLVDPEGPGRVADVVVRELGQVRVAMGEEGGLLGSDLLERPDMSLTVGALAAGSEVVGGLAVNIDDFGADGAAPVWMGEGEPVSVETQKGLLSLLPGDLTEDGSGAGSGAGAGPGAGAWAATPDDGGSRAIVGGIGEALVPSPRTEGELAGDGEDPHTFDVRAVVETAALGDSGPSLVIDGDLTLMGEEQVGVTEGGGAGLTVYSAIVRVPQGGSLAHALRGLDVDGDGAVDLPLVTENRSWDLRPDGDVVTLLGEPYLVTEGDSGWPVLEHLDDPGQRSVIEGAVGMHQELAVTPKRWQWSGEGLVMAVPGWRADPMELVGFTSTDPRLATVDQPEGWLVPRDLVVLESAAGPVTLVSLEPARAAVGGELFVVDEQGQRRSLEQLAVDPGDPSAGAEGQVDGSGGEGAGDVEAGLDGLTLDADLVPSVDGVQLADVGTVAGAGAVLWALPGTDTDPARGLLVVPGRTAEDVVLPVTAKGEGRDLGGGLVLAERTIESPSGPVLVQVLDGVVLSGMEIAGLVALDAEQVAAGAEDQWSIIGVPPSVTVTLTGGLQVAVGVDQDLWVLAPLYGDAAGRPERAEVPEQGAGGMSAQAAVRGSAALAHLGEDGRTLHAVTLLGPDTVPRLVVDGEAQIMSNEAIPVQGGEWLVHHVVVQVPEGSGTLHAPGFDLDEDGEVDSFFPQRG